jgi:hypothetical protein
MSEFDPYAMLGVGREATAGAIKRAYKKRAAKAHPDRAGGDAGLMADVNRAYALLTDEVRRAQFDRTGDIKTPPSIEAKAGELIAQVCIAWVQQDVPQGQPNPFMGAVAVDLLPFVQSQLAAHIGNLENELAKRRRFVAKIDRELKRLTRKSKRPTDPIRGMFDQARGKYEQQIAEFTEHESVAKLALEIVNEYGVTPEMGTLTASGVGRAYVFGTWAT